MAGRTSLFAVSLGAHAVLGLALVAVPARVRHEIIAISMAETVKPKPVIHADPTPPPEPPRPAARAVKAKAAPPPPTAAPPSEATTTSNDALPDYGIALSNGGSSGGVAIPSASGPVARAAVAAAPKSFARASRAQADDCGEPPAKPKLVSRPTPSYTDDARAAGVSGKVRVEITVDDAGRVVSVRVIQGLGHGLDEAAVAAARAMTFEPAIRCGKPTPATFKVGFNFAPGTP